MDAEVGTCPELRRSKRIEQAWTGGAETTFLPLGLVSLPLASLIFVELPAFCVRDSR